MCAVGAVGEIRGARVIESLVQRLSGNQLDIKDQAAEILLVKYNVIANCS